MSLTDLWWRYRSTEILGEWGYNIIDWLTVTNCLSLGRSKCRVRYWRREFSSMDIGDVRRGWHQGKSLERLHVDLRVEGKSPVAAFETIITAQKMWIKVNGVHGDCASYHSFYSWSNELLYRFVEGSGIVQQRLACCARREAMLVRASHQDRISVHSRNCRRQVEIIIVVKWLTYLIQPAINLNGLR